MLPLSVLLRVRIGMGMARVIADVPSRWLASGWFNPCPVQDFKPMLAQPAPQEYKRVMGF
ncbi:MAG: hypothetical protein DWH82_02470 [Planctomycetota bacterium]|nr:MAG: hypothetical protein DWH82_02470 [Planctomycetota bacterium]